MTIFVAPRVLSAYAIKDNERCQCGNFKSVLHCPQCGSTQCYAKTKNNVSIMLPSDVTNIISRGFRCKLCGNIFNEWMTVTSCHAKTRWAQKANIEERVEQIVKNAPIEIQNDILEAARLHMKRRQRQQQAPLESTLDEDTSKLFEPPELIQMSDEELRQAKEHSK